MKKIGHGVGVGRKGTDAPLINFFFFFFYFVFGVGYNYFDLDFIGLDIFRKCSIHRFDVLILLDLMFGLL